MTPKMLWEPNTPKTMIYKLSSSGLNVSLSLSLEAAKSIMLRQKILLRGTKQTTTTTITTTSPTQNDK